MKYNIDGPSLGYPKTNAIKEIKKNKITQIYHVIVCGRLLHHKYSKLFNFITQYRHTVCLINYMVDDDIETLLLNNLKCSIIKSSPTNIKVTYISDIPYL